MVSADHFILLPLSYWPNSRKAASAKRFTSAPSQCDVKPYGRSPVAAESRFLARRTRRTVANMSGIQSARMSERPAQVTRFT
jgi:hypothetical protein